MYLDENDDEAWRSWATEPVASLREALRSVSDDGSWVFYYPISVHPEYRDAVWTLVQKVAGRLPPRQADSWKRRNADWQRLCL